MDDSIQKHFLFPGTLQSCSGECLITTVLGSCVAVCLWDTVSGGGGMNHFMLPLWNGEGLATPKFGNIAMERLLKQLLDHGRRRDHLVAKMFGGANILGMSQAAYPIGQRNIDLAVSMLESWGIPLAAADTGGSRGRKIIMNTLNGTVQVAKARKPE